jgi:hypothetical protein
VHAVAGPGLGQDPADVGLDGGFGQHQVGGDLAVGQAARHDYARLDGEVKAAAAAAPPRRIYRYKSTKIELVLNI